MGRETHLGNCDLGPSLLSVCPDSQGSTIMRMWCSANTPTSPLSSLLRPSLFFPAWYCKARVPSYSRGCLAPVCWAHHPPAHPPPEPLSPEIGLHVPTSLASLTFIVLPGGDAEEAQDVYCGVCPAWRRASVHCGCVREWQAGCGDCQLHCQGDHTLLCSLAPSI